MQVNKAIPAFRTSHPLFQIQNYIQSVNVEEHRVYLSGPNSLQLHRLRSTYNSFIVTRCHELNLGVLLNGQTK